MHAWFGYWVPLGKQYAECYLNCSKVAEGLKACGFPTSGRLCSLVQMVGSSFLYTFPDPDGGPGAF